MQNTSTFGAASFFEAIELDRNFPVSRPAFTAPPGRAHVHDCFEIGLCRSGSGIFLIDDKVFTCMADDAVFINNREFHLLQNATPLNSDWKFVYLDPAALLAGWIPASEDVLDTSRFSGRGFRNVIHGHDHPDIVFLVRRLIGELENEGEGHRSLVRAIVWSLLLLLKRLVPRENPERAAASKSEIQRIYPALQYISLHYAETVEVPHLAAQCHCSLSTFRRVFKASLGCLPQEYLNEFRLKAATAMLQATDRSILEIACKCGFTSLSNFNRQFKAKYNRSPRNYRADFHSR